MVIKIGGKQRNGHQVKRTCQELSRSRHSVSGGRYNILRRTVPLAKETHDFVLYQGCNTV